MIRAGLPLKSREVEYPSSDGKPMAETDLHRDEMVYAIEALREHFRDVYKVWEEGPAPCWVLEVTSKSTRAEDLQKKKDLYCSLGVEEYFLFDPREEYLEPSLQGFRLARGPGSDYRPLLLGADGALANSVLGVVFRREGQGLRLINAQTGAPYLRAQEEGAARREAEQRAAQLEAELARLRQSLK